MLKKKYDFKETEARIQKYWSDNQIYKFNKEADGEVYSIDTPPPTVSGNIHIGHIFSYTQAEMIARYQRMLGRNVFYPFGFDDNGLPTERLVERDLGIIARDMPREDFIGHCLESTAKYENEFKALWQSMGFSCDWDLEYRTIDESSQRISQRSFIELAKANKAYLDESPVLWCSHCQTSIAQAELESKDKQTTFNTIVFKAQGQDIHIATTRPELLYGCVAIFVHPEDDRYKHLIGENCQVPLYGFEVPIIADDQVQMDKGTGIVMCCTFGDTTDLEWFKTYDLPYKKVITATGHIEDKIPLIGGMYVTKARKAIIECLEEKNLLIQREDIDHTVSIHDRCGTTVEIIPSKQWYIDILSHKDEYLKAADEINWYPSHMKKRYLTWVENLKWNWCISRQRFYGVPIPVWYCNSCGEPMLADAESLPINPMTDQPTKSCSCGSNEFTPETAVFDTWATSSVTPEINKRWKEDDEREYLGPMSLRTQAHEIIRTWAFYTIAKSHEHHNQIPWKDIMICGFVLAKKGEKISKSKNNASSTPMKLIENHSADAIRYWAANSRLGTDTMFDEEELKISRRFMTKLWNASKFAMMQLDGFEGYKENHILENDRWIIEKYKACIKQAKHYLDQYEVGLARNTIDEFFWKDFCDNYLEFVKDRLYKKDLYGHEQVLSGQNALYHISKGILKLYSIFVPHITEEIYLNFFSEFEAQPSIHLHTWDITDRLDESYLELGAEIKDILSAARKYKTERNLSMKEPLNGLKIETRYPELMEHCRKDIAACTHSENITIGSASSASIKIS